MRPRELCLRGRQQVVGWVVPRGLLGEAGAQERVALLWRQGATLRALDSAWWIQLPRPQSLRPPWPATPVVQTHAGPAAAAVSPSEVAAIPPGPGLLRIVGGTLVRELGTPEDPATWVEVDEVALPLRPPGPPSAPPPEAPVPRRLEREDLGVPAPSLEALQMLEAARRSAARGQGTHSGAASGLALGAMLLRWLRGLRGAAPSTAGTRPTSRALGRIAGPLSRLLRRLRTWISRGRILQAHQRYLEELAARLRDDDLDEALRWAIPIGGEGGAGELARALPGRRVALRPGSVHRQSAGGAVVGDEDVLGRLRWQYGRALERLKREGRIPEAAFVASDLLGRHERAVLLCEAHGLLSLAADLAEARLDDAPRVIALRARAGDPEGAFRVAAASGAWQAGLTLLEKTDPEVARRLAGAWAARCVAAGEPLRAAEVLLPYPRLHRTAAEWLRPLADAGGLSGTLAHLHLLAMRGEAEHGRAVLSATRDPAVRRAVLTQALSLPLGDRVHPLLRALIRASLPEIPGLNHLAVPHPALTDLLREVREPNRQEVVLTPGTVAVLDAVALPSGHLVFLVPGAVRIHLPGGAELSRHPLAADALVAGPSEVVLALRWAADGYLEVHRGLPLLGRWELWATLPPWTGDGRRWWPDHDGLGWWVCEQDRVRRLDLSSPEARSLVDLAAEPPLSLVSVASDRVVARVGGEGWRWQAPRWRLSSRTSPLTHHGAPLEVPWTVTAPLRWSDSRILVDGTLVAWAPGLVAHGFPDGTLLTAVHLG